jgi:hypothetical protein
MPGVFACPEKPRIVLGPKLLVYGPKGVPIDCVTTIAILQEQQKVRTGSKRVGEATSHAPVGPNKRVRRLMIIEVVAFG